MPISAPSDQGVSTLAKDINSIMTSLGGLRQQHTRASEHAAMVENNTQYSKITQTIGAIEEAGVGQENNPEYWSEARRGVNDMLTEYRNNSQKFQGNDAAQEAYTMASVKASANIEAKLLPQYTRKEYVANQTVFKTQLTQKANDGNINLTTDNLTTERTSAQNFNLDANGVDKTFTDAIIDKSESIIGIDEDAVLAQITDDNGAIDDQALTNYINNETYGAGGIFKTRMENGERKYSSDLNEESTNRVVDSIRKLVNKVPTGGGFNAGLARHENAMSVHSDGVENIYDIGELNKRVEEATQSETTFRQGEWYTKIKPNSADSIKLNKAEIQFTNAVNKQDVIIQAILSGKNKLSDLEAGNLTYKKFNINGESTPVKITKEDMNKAVKHYNDQALSLLSSGNLEAGIALSLKVEQTGLVEKSAVSKQAVNVAKGGYLPTSQAELSAYITVLEKGVSANDSFYNVAKDSETMNTLKLYAGMPPEKFDVSDFKSAMTQVISTNYTRSLAGTNKVSSATTDFMASAWLTDHKTTNEQVSATLTDFSTKELSAMTDDQISDHIERNLIGTGDFFGEEFVVKINGVNEDNKASIFEGLNQAIFKYNTGNEDKNIPDKFSLDNYLLRTNSTKTRYVLHPIINGVTSPDPIGSYDARDLLTLQGEYKDRTKFKAPKHGAR